MNPSHNEKTLDTDYIRFLTKENSSLREEIKRLSEKKAPRVKYNELVFFEEGGRLVMGRIVKTSGRMHTINCVYPAISGERLVPISCCQSFSLLREMHYTLKEFHESVMMATNIAKSRAVRAVQGEVNV